MDSVAMPGRLRFCRKLNATICRFSAAAALLAVTRWLHINNVNGFRYLGYAFTCPMMQAELVVLIAPVVPHYRIVTKLTAAITFLMLVSGYIASQFEGPIWDGDLIDLDFGKLTTKGRIALPSFVALSFLSFLHIPLLGLLYYCNGGGKDGKLPRGYPKLLVITSLTWLGFPCWWVMSFEGNSYIQDTKLNGLGFVLLNMTSKGCFTMQMLSIVRQWKRDFGPQQPPMPEAPEPPFSSRSRKTDNSADWIIDSLQSWDTGVALERRKAADEYIVHGPEQQAPAPPERVVRLDTSSLSDAVLVSELSRRLNLLSSEDSDVTMGTPLTAQALLDNQIALACARFVDEDDDGLSE
jgi:bacteriorhodopsin